MFPFQQKLTYTLSVIKNTEEMKLILYPYNVQSNKYLRELNLIWLKITRGTASEHFSLFYHFYHFHVSLSVLVIVLMTAAAKIDDEHIKQQLQHSSITFIVAGPKYVQLKESE